MSWYGRFVPSVMYSSVETSSQVPIIFARTLLTLSWSARAATRKQTTINNEPATKAEVRRITFPPLALKPGHFNPQGCIRPAQKLRGGVPGAVANRLVQR